MNARHYLLLLFILIVSAMRGSAQQYSCLHFLTKDGLASNNIYTITQDKDGFIWAATETGLSKFDGSSFINFTTKDGLPGNEIISLFADHKNRLWISPFKKEICYYYQGKIYNRSNSPLIQRIAISSEGKSIAEDAAGKILIESNDNFTLIDNKDSCLQLPNPYKGRGFFIPLCGFRYLSNDILDSSLKKWVKGSNAKHVYNFYNEHHTLKNVYWEIGKDIWIFRDSVLGKLPIPPSAISNYPLNDSLFVFNTRDGSYVYDIRTRALLYHLLKGFWVNHTFVDKEQGIWIATNGSGIFYFPPGNSISVSRSPANTPLQIRNFYLPGFNKLCIGISDSRFWEIDRASRGLKQLINKRDVGLAFFKYPKGNLIRQPDEVALRQTETSLGVHFPTSIKSLGWIGEDTMLLATANNASILWPQCGQPLIFWKSRATCALAVDDTCYVGTLSGLYKLPKKGLFNPDANRPRQIMNGSVTSLAWSVGKKLLWVITSDRGACCFSEGRIIRVFNESNGLSSNICKNIYTDGSNAYVATNNGLNVIYPDRNFAIARYYTVDGLVSNDINCVFATADSIWVGTSEGYSFLNTGWPSAKAYCGMHINAFSVREKTLFPNGGSIVLSPTDNDVELHYSGLSFRSMGHMQYTYRLRGLGDSWQTTEARTLKYPSLPSGEYSFEIYATNRFGVKSPIQVLRFRIRPFWWQYWWLQLLAALAVAGVGLVTVRLRIRRIRKRIQRQAAIREKISDLEQRALRAQMNPHFIFNSLNSFYQYLIHKDLNGANAFMNDFASLLRMVFEINSQSEITLDKEIDFISTYLRLEQTKRNQGFTYSVQLIEDFPLEYYHIPTFIIQPFVENSIRHGVGSLTNKKGHIDLRVTADTTHLNVTIEDNGPGISCNKQSKEKPHTSHRSRGIALTRERIAMYNQTRDADIRVVIDRCDSRGGGTLVRISFPLKDIM